MNISIGMIHLLIRIALSVLNSYLDQQQDGYWSISLKVKRKWIFPLLCVILKFDVMEKLVNMLKVEIHCDLFLSSLQIKMTNDLMMKEDHVRIYSCLWQNSK